MMYHNFDIESVVQIRPRLALKKDLPPNVINRSPTDSLESYNNLARKETIILWRNHRQATVVVVLRIHKFLSKQAINAYRKKVFAELSKREIIAVANIEPTTDGFDNLTGNVHFHILIAGNHTEDDLRNLLTAACLMAGLKNKMWFPSIPKDEFSITYETLYNYRRYIRYFTKYNPPNTERPHRVNLFTKGERGKPGTRIQRFYTIGNFFIDAEGNPTTKTQIWEEYKQELQEKTRAKCEAQSPPPPMPNEKADVYEFCNYEEAVNMMNIGCDEDMRCYEDENEPQSPDEVEESIHHDSQHRCIENYPDDPPADITKLKAFVDGKSDIELDDYQHVLHGESPPFHTDIPDWLYHLQGQKYEVLSWAIEQRLRPDIAKLIKLIGNETDLMLRDWRRVLYDEAPLFHTDLPGWLYTVWGWKRKVLLHAIDQRLRPTNFIKLKETLDRENDVTLYNLFCRLTGRPMLFDADLPPWLGYHLVHGQKRQDLLDAICARLRRSRSQRIVSVVKAYRGF